MVCFHVLGGSLYIEWNLVTELDSLESGLKIIIDFVMPEVSFFFAVYRPSFLTVAFLDCTYCYKSPFRAPDFLSELDLLIVI